MNFLSRPYAAIHEPTEDVAHNLKSTRGLHGVPLPYAGSGEVGACVSLTPGPSQRPPTPHPTAGKPCPSYRGFSVLRSCAQQVFGTDLLLDEGMQRLPVRFSSPLSSADHHPQLLFTIYLYFFPGLTFHSFSNLPSRLKQKRKPSNAARQVAYTEARKRNM